MLRNDLSLLKREIESPGKWGIFLRNALSKILATTFMIIMFIIVLLGTFKRMSAKLRGIANNEAQMRFSNVISAEIVIKRKKLCAS